MNAVVQFRAPPRSCPVIGSRFNGPAVRKDADGTYEHVLPELTATDEELQVALIAHTEPKQVYVRGLFGLNYPGARI